MEAYLLSSMIWIPFALAALLWLPFLSRKLAWALSLGASLWILALALWLMLPGQSGVQSAYLPWFSLELSNVGKIQFDYFLIADGLSKPMLLLTGISLGVASIASYKVQQQAKGYFSLFLILAGSIAGSFLAADFLLFFLFFEFMLLPMYFLVGIWGGVRRTYAAIKFFLYTLVGSLFILVVLVAMYGQMVHLPATAEATGLSQSQVWEALQKDELRNESLIYGVHMVNSELGIQAWSAYKAGGILDMGAAREWKGRTYRQWAFLLLLLGFLIKLPAVPLHTWLPDAHVEASTPISVILAAVLLKLGGYGLFRLIIPAFPEATLYYTWLLAFLGVLSIWFGALNALAQQDLKKLVAYSSVSHMGFVLLGIGSHTIEGYNGAYYQLFSHGLISALLFLVVGVLYDRVQDRNIANFSGLAKLMPAFAVVAGAAFFASLGLPGFSGFIAEILVLIGAFDAAIAAESLPLWMAIMGALGLILAAAYSLWAFQRVWMGNVFLRKQDWENSLRDLVTREKLMLYPLVILIIFFGIWPAWLLDQIKPVLESLLFQLEALPSLIL